jgi:hypothetical protein
MITNGRPSTQSEAVPARCMAETPMVLGGFLSELRE